MALKVKKKMVTFGQLYGLKHPEKKSVVKEKDDWHVCSRDCVPWTLGFKTIGDVILATISR